MDGRQDYELRARAAVLLVAGFDLHVDVDVGPRPEARGPEPRDARHRVFTVGGVVRGDAFDARLREPQAFVAEHHWHHPHEGRASRGDALLEADLAGRAELFPAELRPRIARLGEGLPGLPRRVDGDVPPRPQLMLGVRVHAYQVGQVWTSSRVGVSSSPSAFAMTARTSDSVTFGCGTRPLAEMRLFVSACCACRTSSDG